VANKKKGNLTVVGEWAKHLRKFLKRQFWKGERKAGNKLIEQEKKQINYR
jgi:hypothetical protein